MPRNIVDGIEIEVPQGATVLRACALAGMGSGGKRRLVNAAAVFGLAAAMALGTASAQPVAQSSAAARVAMHRFGACVADRSPAKAAQTLATDFRTTPYRLALRALANNNRDCFRSGRMRSAGLAFAGAIAERLLLRDPAPLNARLVRAAARPGPPPLGSADSIAICVVRSTPDDVARLFATDVASAAEAASVASLQVAVNLCSQGKPRLETNVEGLRAMLATASFRTLGAPAAAERG